MPFLLTAAFDIFPDDHLMGPWFRLASIDFADVVPAGPPTSFVNLTDGTRGLQFPDTGLDVVLPLEVSWARLRVGAFNSPFVIEALDALGNVLRRRTVSVLNAYHDVTIATRGGLSSLALRGGGNEGVLVELSIIVP